MTIYIATPSATLSCTIWESALQRRSCKVQWKSSNHGVFAILPTFEDIPYLLASTGLSLDY